MGILEVKKAGSKADGLGERHFIVNGESALNAISIF
jgi:hypothetical protein